MVISRVGTELLDAASPGKTILGSGLSTTLIHWQDMRVQFMIAFMESLPAEEIKKHMETGEEKVQFCSPIYKIVEMGI